MVHKMSRLASIVAVLVLHASLDRVMGSSLRSQNRGNERNDGNDQKQTKGPGGKHGASCESGDDQNTRVDCVLDTTFNATGAQCNATTGLYSKYFNVKTQPLNGGAQCSLTLQPTTEPCGVDCVLDTTFNATGAQCNATTGLYSKYFNVKTQLLNGGAQCSLTLQPTTEPCPVDCVLKTKEADTTAYDNNCVEKSGVWYESRTRAIAVEAKNGGKCEPVTDTKKCEPVACVRYGPTENLATNPFAPSGTYDMRRMSRVPDIKTVALYGGACPADAQTRGCSTSEFWNALKADTAIENKYITRTSSNVQATAQKQSDKINFYVNAGKVEALSVSWIGTTTNNFGNNGVVASDGKTIEFQGSQTCFGGQKKVLVINIKQCSANGWKFDPQADQIGSSCKWNMDMSLPC